MTTREQIFSALFSLVATGEGGASTAAWNETGAPALTFCSRRIRMFDALPSQPAMCQGEFTESFTQKPGLPYTRIMEAEWWFFHTAGSDPNAIPTITDNLILDACEAVLAPPPYEMNNLNSLGGLVHHCFIDGVVAKVSGDIEGQALVIVPIKVLVP